MTSAFLTADALAELRRLDAEATAGPWESIPQNGAGPIIAHRFETGKQMNPHGLRLVCHVLARRDSLAQDNANSAVIPAARNALPALLSELEQSRVERKEMMQLLADAVTLIEGETRGVRSITTTEGHAFVKAANALLSRARQRTQTGE